MIRFRNIGFGRLFNIFKKTKFSKESKKGARAVSYTHLDVYKRQELTRFNEIELFKFIKKRFVSKNIEVKDIVLKYINGEIIVFDGAVGSGQLEQYISLKELVGCDRCV